MGMNDTIGFVAAALVFLSFSTKRMVPLRATAIASNLAFITYAGTAGLLPILVLHLAMLPINLLRLHQELRPPTRSL
jgi:hypothetical protein